MMRFPSPIFPAALLLVSAPFLFSQSTASSSQQTPQVTTRSFEQNSEVVFSPVDQKLEFFELEHRAADRIESQDAELLKNRRSDILKEGEFYGYDVSERGWSYEQSVCPLIPDYIMLHYSSKDATGADSLFTVLVPRNGGRILIVPVLSHGATQFKPAPIDPRNYQLFSQLVPADIAKKNSGPDGKWLSLSVCYAEMTGARPLVPNHPSLDVRMIKAPQPTLRIYKSGVEHEVRFTDPISQTEFRLWDITYNEGGRIIGVSDDRHGFGEPIAKTAPEPTPKPVTQPPPPPVKQTHTIPPATPFPPKTGPQ
jgi:hypothetical protein